LRFKRSDEAFRTILKRNPKKRRDRKKRPHNPLHHTHKKKEKEMSDKDKKKVENVTETSNPQTRSEANTMEDSKKESKMTTNDVNLSISTADETLRANIRKANEIIKKICNLKFQIEDSKTYTTITIQPVVGENFTNFVSFWELVSNYDDYDKHYVGHDDLSESKLDFDEEGSDDSGFEQDCFWCSEGLKAMTEYLKKEFDLTQRGINLEMTNRRVKTYRRYNHAIDPKEMKDAQKISQVADIELFVETFYDIDNILEEVKAELRNHYGPKVASCLKYPQFSFKS
jgi:hypothetical protein